MKNGEIESNESEIVEQIENKSMDNTPYVTLNSEQWTKIKPHVIISSYGNAVEFFPSIEAMKKSSKIVTLNGSPIRAQKGRIQTAITDRLSGSNTIVKLPNGQFAVMSKTLAQKAGIGFTVSAKLPDGL